MAWFFVSLQQKTTESEIRLLRIGGFSPLRPCPPAPDLIGSGEGIYYHPCTQCPSPGNHTASTTEEIPTIAAYPINSPRNSGCVFRYKPIPPSRSMISLINQAIKALNPNTRTPIVC